MTYQTVQPDSVSPTNRKNGTQTSRIWPIVILLSALATAWFVLFDVDGPLRAPITLWFLLICPGMSFVPLLRLENAGYELILAVALSLILNLLVAIALLYTGLWFYPFVMAALIALSLIGVQCQLFMPQPVRHPRQARLPTP